MKNLVTSLFFIFMVFLLFGCSNATELVDEIDDVNEADSDLINDYEDNNQPDESSTPDEGTTPEDNGDEEEDNPLPLDPIVDVWMPQISMPEITILLDKETGENLNELFDAYLNKDYYQIITITINNPFEPVLVNEETIAYTKSKILEYEIDKLELDYRWYTTTLYIYPAIVSFDQFSSLFSLSQKTDVVVKIDFYVNQ